MGASEEAAHAAVHTYASTITLEMDPRKMIRFTQLCHQQKRRRMPRAVQPQTTLAGPADQENYSQLTKLPREK